MDMEMKRRKHRKMDKRTLKKIMRETIEQDPFKLRTQVNTENILLLLADPDLAAWAKRVRQRNDIPENGFKSAKQVARWQKTKRNEELFDNSLVEIYTLYTKINEQYMPYIKAFVIHNTNFEDKVIKPMPSTELGRMEVFFETVKAGRFRSSRSKKIPQMRLEIYQQPTNEQWEQALKEIREYFEEFGIETGAKAPMPLGDKIKIKLIALKTMSKDATKRTANGLITDVNATRQIIVNTYPDISEPDMQIMLSKQPQE